jgi:hypothetical protein
MSERIGSLDVLDKPGTFIAGLVRKLLPGGAVKDALSGTWMGHALHPLLTDVPIGTWTSATMLDVVGGADSERAAEILIAVGIAAAVPTAVTGWSDWADTEPDSDEVRRLGIVHAASNGTARSLRRLAGGTAARTAPDGRRAGSRRCGCPRRRRLARGRPRLRPWRRRQRDRVRSRLRGLDPRARREHAAREPPDRGGVR